MMMRSVIGSLAVVGALGALAAVLPERHSQTTLAPAPTFGTLPKLASSAAPQDQAGSQTDQQSLVKLAAYTGSRDGGTPAPAPAAAGNAANGATADTPLVRAIRVVGPVVTPPPASPAVTVASVVASPTLAAPDPLPAPPSAAAPVPQAVAALPPAQAPQPTSSGRININRASVAELDHLPGGGRIGAAIARRRPYHAVDDLVRKRVLRAGLYARIRSAITVD